MGTTDRIDGTGVYRNEQTQCFEFWAVRPETGERALLSSCSLCVPAGQYQWWYQQVRRLGLGAAARAF